MAPTQQELSKKQKSAFDTYKVVIFMYTFWLWLVGEFFGFLIAPHTLAWWIVKAFIAVVYLPIVLWLLPKLWEKKETKPKDLTGRYCNKWFNVRIIIVLAFLYWWFILVKIVIEAQIANCRESELNDLNQLNCVREVEENRFASFIWVYRTIEWYVKK